MPASPPADPAALTALENVAALARARARGRAPLIGVAGAQGSGKSTLLAAYAASHPDAVVLSIDDVYLPPAARLDLAARVHPLLATRGPPGTHDLALLHAVFDGLIAGAPTPLPRFDKLADAPFPRETWRTHEGAPCAILLDGWCVGALAQSAVELAAPINALEAEEDSGGAWRTFVNAQLAGPYREAFARLDAILALDAPDFSVVLDWRCEQEEGLLGRPLDAVGRTRIARFIAHYERITRHMLAGGRRADIVLRLDAQRQVIAAAR